MVNPSACAGSLNLRIVVSSGSVTLEGCGNVSHRREGLSHHGLVHIKRRDALMRCNEVEIPLREEASLDARRARVYEELERLKAALYCDGREVHVCRLKWTRFMSCVNATVDGCLWYGSSA